jgi:hypothetical protein
MTATAPAIPEHFRPDDRVCYRGEPATVLRTEIEINRSTAWVSYLVQLDHPAACHDGYDRSYASRTFRASHHELTPLTEGASP